MLLCSIFGDKIPGFIFPPLKMCVIAKHFFWKKVDPIYL